MKIKYLGIALSVALTTSAIAQKDQIKALEKAMKGNDINAVKSAITNAESTLSSATDVEKTQFFYLKGMALYDLVKKNADKNNNLIAAAQSFIEMEALEKNIGKNKFTMQSKGTIDEIKGVLLNGAIDDQNNNRFSLGVTKLELLYAMSGNPEMLYYAANFSVMGKDYDKALVLYEELKRINYSGEGIYYQAKNVINDQYETFNTKSERDLAIKFKTHVEPKEEKIPSKRGEIYSNIALILVEKGRIEEAKKALKEARDTNPDDIGLMMAEADLYYKEENYDQYMSILQDAANKMPNSPELFFNLGVAAGKINNFDLAIEYYEKAIKANPKYADAYFNIAIVKIDRDQKLVDEMNSLGNSAKENQRYDEIKKERAQLFLDAMPYLEKNVELDPKNIDAMKTLLNIYSLLDMTDKYKALKAKMDN